MMDGYLTAEVSASAIGHNLALLRRRIGPRTKLCAVVKADAYGHGLALLLDTLSRQVDHLAVATPEEAMAVRRWGYTGPLLVFFSLLAWSNGSSLLRQLTSLVAADVELTVVSVEEIKPIAEAARCAQRPARVHLKIDSGMGRSGALPQAVPALMARLRAQLALRLVGA